MEQWWSDISRVSGLTGIRTNMEDLLWCPNTNNPSHLLSGQGTQSARHFIFMEKKVFTHHGPTFSKYILTHTSIHTPSHTNFNYTFAENSYIYK